MSDSFKMYVPIEKIDQENRTISGWATTEKVDKQNEIVDYGASKSAFGDWQGNIREMHEPKAVGKAVEILPNDDTKKIFVKAYISKGAEDTWHKINEGILQGFSIGGKTINKTTQIIKDMDNPNSPGKTITRITKYRLNELSLVDNPANPECQLELIKMADDGVLYQTEIVEDLKKVIITDAEDTLQKEVDLHRSKADSLVKKVLESTQLEKLNDDNFGLIRKVIKDGTLTKERLIPIPDKVHAVRALEVIDSYNLSDTEKFIVHDRAVEKLGTAHDSESCKYCISRGGENDMELSKAVAELTAKVNSLVEWFSKGDYQGAYRPIPGAKNHPNTQKANDSTPDLGASKPLDAIDDPTNSDLQTQDPKGSYPAKGPVKFADDEESLWRDGVRDAIVTKAEQSEVEEQLEDEVDHVLEVADYIDKMSDEEYDEFTKSLDEDELADLDEILDVVDKAQGVVEKAGNLANSSLKTQEDIAAPTGKGQGYNGKGYPRNVKKDGADSEGSRYPGKHPATSDLHTQDPKGAYPAKGPVKRMHEDEEYEEGKETEREEEEEENGKKKKGFPTKKSEDGQSENDLAKAVAVLSNQVEHLSKKAKPRKMLIEKNQDANLNDGVEEQLQKRQEEIKKWRASGKELTSEQQTYVDETLSKMLDRKIR